MIVCYLAAICPQKYYYNIENEISIAAYQFNSLLLHGFASIDSIDVRCVVPFSLLRRLETNELGQMVEEGKIKYYIFDKTVVRAGYYKYVLETIKKIKEWERTDRVVIITDALGISVDIVSTIARMFCNSVTVGIVTDLPQYVINTDSLRGKLRCNLNLLLMKKFDKYILLTKQMEEQINKKHRPQCIVEGVCNFQTIGNGDSQGKYKKKVCMYAGSLHKEYGIDMLIQAFIRADVENSELHIYGNGNYSREVEDICKKYSNILYFGQRGHEEILKEEKKAWLLINPRPTTAEYTKYSFPSKTLEYMASGTPVLMTCLPGMPKDYKEHVYLFEDESIDGYAKKIKEVLLQEKGLEEKGTKAKDFILKTRNNKIQAERIVKELELL